MAKISLTNNTYTQNRKNNHVKLFMRMQEIARMTALNYPDPIIMQHCGVTRTRLSSIRIMPEFKEILEEILNTKLGKWDDKIQESIEQAKKVWQTTVMPLAQKTILEALVQRKDLRVAMEAAKVAYKLDPLKTFSEDRQPGATPSAQSIPNSMMDRAVADSDALKVANASQSAPSAPASTISDVPDAPPAKISFGTKPITETVQ